jgi:hypothetical protein
MNHLRSQLNISIYRPRGYKMDTLIHSDIQEETAAQDLCGYFETAFPSCGGFSVSDCADENGTTRYSVNVDAEKVRLYVVWLSIEKDGYYKVVEKFRLISGAFLAGWTDGCSRGYDIGNHESYMDL